MPGNRHSNSPFARAQLGSRPQSPRFVLRPALAMALLCLVPGLAAVGWLAQRQSDVAHTQARLEARVRCANLESQLNHALTTVELLGTVARQNASALSNFQKVGAELLAACPVLASLELEPGGVISDIVPRAGHERILGLNVLKNPVQSPSAYAAIQGRVLNAAGPFTLEQGKPGLIVRLPLFHRGLDGREYFWGFVAGTVGLSEALARARVEELAAQGYSYAFYACGPSHQKGVTIAARGPLSLGDAVYQPVQVRNLEFRLAVRPQAGWMDSMQVTLESLGVLMLSGLLYIMANKLQSRSLASEKQSAAAREAELKLVDQKTQLEQKVRGADEAVALFQAQLNQAELRASDLQAQLDAAVRTASGAEGRQVELAQAQIELQQSRQKIQELDARLEEAVSAERKSAAKAQARHQQDQASIAELQRRLDLATQVAKESAELNANSVRRLEQTNQELTKRLSLAEQARNRVTELTALLEQTQAKLERLQADSPAADPSKAKEGNAEESTASKVEGAEEASAPSSTLPVEEPPNDQLVAETSSDNTAVPGAPEVTEETMTSSTTTSAGLPTAKENLRQEVAPPEALSKRRVSKLTKREKLRRDHQMDLFAGTPPAEKPTARPEANGRAGMPADEESQPHAEDLAASAAGKPAGGNAKAGADLDADPGSLLKAKPDKPARSSSQAPPVNLSQLRKAVNEILPLLVDRDPGAKDCLKANRATFRSAFGNGFAEFEQAFQSSGFGTALEQLKRAAKRHGIAV